MSRNYLWRWGLWLVGLLLAVLLTAVTTSGQSLTPANPNPLTRNHTLYVPLILNVHGATPNRMEDSYQIAVVDGTGGWLYGPASRTATLLRANLPLTTTIFAAPTGEQVALGLADGWALYDHNAHPIADQIAPGYQLDWDQTPDHLLVSKLGEGISRLRFATGQRSLLLQTTDETNDHSPIWGNDGQSLIFAHQEFGEELAIMQIQPFEQSQLPYAGENRTAAKFNPLLTLLLATASWHDQPIRFHWSTDGQTLIFAARQQIHLLNLETGSKLSVAPTGFGTTLATSTVDVDQDRILYAGSGGLFLAGLDGGTGELLIAGDGLQQPRWSPDGTQILYLDEVGALRIADAANPSQVTVAVASPVGSYDILPQVQEGRMTR